MITFTVRTNDNEYPSFEVSRHLIERIVDSLTPVRWDFLVLKPSEMVQNSTFIQVGAPDIVVDSQYTIEMVFQTAEKRHKMYRLYTKDKKLVLQYVTEYLEEQRVPDISSWEDVTHENPNF